MKDGFIHKLNILNIVVTSLRIGPLRCRAVYQNFMILFASAAKCDTRVEKQPPNSPLIQLLLPVAIAVGVGYKPHPKNIFVIKNIIGQYCPCTILL